MPTFFFYGSPTTILQVPSLSHTFGTPDSKPQTDSQFFTREVEVALGVSFKDQSKASDIPCISTHNSLSLYTGSFNTQSKVPHIFSHTSKEELSGSFNVQDQDPDDECYVQDSQWFPHDVF